LPPFETGALSAKKSKKPSKDGFFVGDAYFKRYEMLN
jgi:hypothetical protein